MSDATRQAALKQLLSYKRAADNYLDFVQLMYPQFTLAPFQIELINALDLLERRALYKPGSSEPVNNLLITMPPRHAKPLAVGTLIPTPLGLRPIIDLKAGDEVFSASGQPVRIRATSPIFLDNDCYRVTLSDGSSVIADADHLWTTRLCRKRPVFKEKTTRTLYERQQSNPNARAPRLPDQCAVTFPPADLPIQPYLLGSWLGDGARNTGRISVGSEDRSHLASQITACGYQVTQSPASHSANYINVTDLKPALRSLGMLNDKHIPEAYFTSSEFQRRSLLKGLMDTDGTVAPDGQCFFCNTSKSLIDGVRRLLFSLGIKNSLIEGRAILNGKDCGPSYKVTFYDDDCFTLPRKRERCKAPSRFGRYIQKIEPVTSVPTCCILLESEDAIFLAGEGHIPTHNSTWGTINFPAYFLGRDPRRHFMSVSYNSVLARGFGRSVREIFKEPLYHNIFPHSRMSSDKTASDAFITTQGGNYYSIGLNGTTTGRAANCLLIDDPFKSRQDAESRLIRDRVWDFYTGSLSNRREPEIDGSLPIHIVTLTRWHPDDLAGRLMESEEWKDGLWHHINFPAIDEQGNALWPERFNLKYLNREKAKSERDFEALFQQNPTIRGGNLIKTEWFKRYDEPADNYVSLIITADTAFNAKEKSDYSVFLISGLTADGDIHILDLVRGRWDYPTTKQMAIATYARYRGHGLRGIYIENKSSGHPLIQDMRTHSGMSVIPYNVGMTDKIARTNINLPILEGGRVYLPKEATWLNEFLKETSAFPSGIHDDIVDAFIMALDILSRVGISANQLIDPSPIGQSLKSLLQSPTDPLAPRIKEERSLNSLIKSGRLPRPPGFG
jgi:predicted phage terminase large subunit-like protein